MATKSPKPITVEDLYPDLSSAEQELAADNLRRYVATVATIAGRLENIGPRRDLPVDKSI